jgi:hypothetical protein
LDKFSAAISKSSKAGIAEQILVSLSSREYRGIEGTNNNFILTHSVGHKLAGS